MCFSITKSSWVWSLNLTLESYCLLQEVHPKIAGDWATSSQETSGFCGPFCLIPMWPTNPSLDGVEYSQWLQKKCSFFWGYLLVGLVHYQLAVASVCWVASLCQSPSVGDRQGVTSVFFAGIFSFSVFSSLLWEEQQMKNWISWTFGC